ncbi:hypothetical protein FOZG_18165 [Fusarium oxysporum Fo47]|uniref:Uncharacterized protein n=1 Tax=Fusarium oxysporum Fo47 TaxID=660027 RepID=W9JCF2_FUSOX|nr:hypothetical protein FOZG_18165 [Fusarium oxysporum Fo47]
MDLDVELKRVNRVRISLAENPTLAASQESTLTTIINLIQEDHVQREKHSEAARSRRKSARALLSTIHRDLGSVILFLCSTAFSISKLYKIKSHATQFISKLKTWNDGVEITDGIVSLARKYFTTSLLERLVPDDARATQIKRGAHFPSHTTKRSRTDPNSLEHVAIPSYHGVIDLAKHQPLNKTPTDDYNDGSHSENSDSTEGSEDGDESDSGEVQAAQSLVDNPDATVEDDVQLYSNVYELEDMDVIRVVANQREDFTARLTVPHFPDATPFITISCPRTLAVEFLTRRKEVKW